VNQRIRVDVLHRVRSRSGDDGQGKGSDADAKSEQRHDPVRDVAASLTWWFASVPKPHAAKSPCQQSLAEGDQRHGDPHGGMLPWLALADTMAIGPGELR
jgi:hypothetical protein